MESSSETQSKVKLGTFIFSTIASAAVAGTGIGLIFTGNLPVGLSLLTMTAGIWCPSPLQIHDMAEKKIKLNHY